MFVKHEITFDEMGDFLWGNAREKWNNASKKQQRMIWDILEDSFNNEVPEDVAVNDAVEYDFNDIFFPEDEGDEDYDESLKQNKLESRIKRLEKLMLRK